MTQQTIRIGLIGTGRIGQVHARSIAAAPDATLSWVADPFIAGAQAIAEAQGAKATDSAEELIASGELDAVLIASPTATHVQLIEASVKAGLPALCEKPIDLDIAKVDALRPLVAASDVPVALGFNRRFDPHFASARARVAAGEIGDIEQLIITSRDPAPPPADYVAVSGGMFRDMTIHDFDMARFFVDDIIAVNAMGSCTFDTGAREHGDFDTGVTTLSTVSGAIVTIVNSRHSAAGYDQRIEAFGGKGMLRVENTPSSVVNLYNADVVEAAPPYPEFFLERYVEAYSAELREFVKLVKGERSTSPTFEDGRAALVLANAAQRSATEGVTVRVEL